MWLLIEAGSWNPWDDPSGLGCEDTSSRTASAFHWTTFLEGSHDRRIVFRRSWVHPRDKGPVAQSDGFLFSGWSFRRTASTTRIRIWCGLRGWHFWCSNVRSAVYVSSTDQREPNPFSVGRRNWPVAHHHNSRDVSPALA